MVAFMIAERLLHLPVSKTLPLKIQYHRRNGSGGLNKAGIALALKASPRTLHEGDRRNIYC